MISRLGVNKFIFAFAIFSNFFGAFSWATPGYDIVIVAGQSNAVGAGLGPYTDSYKTPRVDARIFQVGRNIPNCVLDDGKVVAASDVLEHWNNCPSSGGIGFGMAFARRWVIHNLANDRNVLIVPAAYGGTSLNQWVDSSVIMDKTANLYQDLIKKTRFALAAGGSQNRIVAILWLQGESDVLACVANPTLYPLCDYNNYTHVWIQWINRTSNLFHSFRQQFSASTIPIAAGGFVPSWTAWQTGHQLNNIEAWKTNFETQLSLYQKIDSQFTYIDPVNLKSNADIGITLPTLPPDLEYDSLHGHYSAASQIELGNRFFQAVQLLLGRQAEHGPVLK
jgi:hypothetical protein